MRQLLLLLWVLTLLGALISSMAQNEQCGSQAGGALCPGGLCCSRYGFCGNTPPYCTDGCQSQCTNTPTPTPTPTPSTGGGDLASIITQSVFNDMFRHRSDPPNCQGAFYTYNAFIAAARTFGGFATVGDADTRRREVAAFLAQTSHETTGGWPAAPDGPYAWGYCFVTERDPPQDYCRPSTDWPCAANRRYFGRGPMQLSWNYNYGPAGRAIGSDLLGNPDLVSSDATISFRAAFWFWMTPQGAKPSCHDVITGRWTPSAADSAAGRVAGYGLLTNIINGGVECGRGSNAQVEDRIGFYRRYTGLLGVSPGNNLDCYSQTPYPA